MKILILGTTGMLGSTLLKVFSKDPDLKVQGTARDASKLKLLPSSLRHLVSTGLDALSTDEEIEKAFKDSPDIVINCVGIIKQLESAKDPLTAIPINALFPHRLAKICKAKNARLIHISTDCVFSGLKGKYLEDDAPDARDLYGLSKYLGETCDSHTITLRTSIIGHELSSNQSLLEWFLSQNTPVNGFTKAIFSGLPTNEVARVIKNFVLPNPHLSGLYHLSVDPINKYDLLTLIAQTYKKDIEINPYEDFKIDRSLDSKKFREATGYKPPSWPTLIENMHKDYIEVQHA